MPLVPVTQKEVGHGSKLVAEIPGNDAGTLDDVVISVLVDVFTFALKDGKFADIAVFVNEFLGGLALKTVAPEKDSFAF